ncbi:MAG: helix-turn-helix domain-containing protein [Opitutaceae bacterium]
MKAKPHHLSVPERASYRRLEDVVGCKWSAAVLAAIGRGVTRPGQLERFIPGISTKVLNERLRKLLDYGLITRQDFPGKVLRVEYRLTPTGRALTAIIEQIRDLDERHAQRAP